MDIELSPSLARALRDIADGHLEVRRRADGTDAFDRVVVGAPAAWWEILRERGLYQPPSGPGRWTLTAEGLRLGDQLIAEARRRASGRA